MRGCSPSFETRKSPLLTIGLTRGRGDPPRAIAHIGVLFSDLADQRKYRLLGFARFYHFLSAPEFNLEPAFCRTARLDRAALPLPEEKPAAPTAPARADRPFRGIALILASTVFLGTSDVTAKYLSATLPSVEIAWLPVSWCSR